MKKFSIIIILLCLSIFVYTVITIHNTNKLQNVSLELPNGTPEILVTLKGTLKLKSILEENATPIYCWFLEMNASSFKIASKTPVWGYALTLKDILEKPNWNEVQLGRDKETEDFCCKHRNQKVTVKGFLFHAHTGHHHAPFLMDIKEIYQE
jgi:hypothetical protein